MNRRSGAARVVATKEITREQKDLLSKNPFKRSRTSQDNLLRSSTISLNQSSTQSPRLQELLQLLENHLDQLRQVREGLTAFWIDLEEQSEQTRSEQNCNNVEETQPRPLSPVVHSAADSGVSRCSDPGDSQSPNAEDSQQQQAHYH